MFKATTIPDTSKREQTIDNIFDTDNQQNFNFDLNFRLFSIDSIQSNEQILDKSKSFAISLSATKNL